MVIRVPDQRSARGAYERLDDRMLVLDFQAGHPEAFVEIHNRYSPLARRVCLRFLRNQQDADEAFQETMIRVFQGLHRFNGRYALSPWVARIAKNVSLDMIRTRGRRPQEEHEGTDAPELQDKGETPEAAYERLVERDLVLSVLADMPVPHRDALVLRELEGRSHRDIAHELDISTSQAKALIHRAKASFRRRWLVAVTEKGMLSAIAVLPLLWAAKVIDVGKRVVDRVGHATHLVQAATPEVVAAASASSAAPVAAVGISERVVAAGMTILLAGGVTVGAAKIVEHRADRTNEAAVLVAPVLEEIGAVAPEEPEGDVETDPLLEGPAPPVEPIRPPVVEPLPSVDPSPSPEPTLPPETSPPPEASPPPETPAPIPTIPPAPAWSFDFVSSTESVESCECDGTSHASTTLETLGPEGFSFSQVITGAGVRDAAGDQTWPYALQQWGEIDPSLPGGGRLDYRFVLMSGVAGDFVYYGSAVLAETVVDEDGSTVYRFEGTYGLLSPQSAAPGLPGSGFVSATIGVWQDGTIYVGSLALSDTQS